MSASREMKEWGAHPLPCQFCGGPGGRAHYPECFTNQGSEAVWSPSSHPSAINSEDYNSDYIHAGPPSDSSFNLSNDSWGPLSLPNPLDGSQTPRASSNARARSYSPPRRPRHRGRSISPFAFPRIIRARSTSPAARAELNAYLDDLRIQLRTWERGRREARDRSISPSSPYRSMSLSSHRSTSPPPSWPSTPPRSLTPVEAFTPPRLRGNLSISQSDFERLALVPFTGCLTSRTLEAIKRIVEELHRPTGDLGSVVCDNIPISPEDSLLLWDITCTGRLNRHRISAIENLVREISSPTSPGADDPYARYTRRRSPSPTRYTRGRSPSPAQYTRRRSPSPAPCSHSVGSHFLDSSSHIRPGSLRPRTPPLTSLPETVSRGRSVHSSVPRRGRTPSPHSLAVWYFSNNGRHPAQDGRSIREVEHFWRLGQESHWDRIYGSRGRAPSVLHGQLRSRTPSPASLQALWRIMHRLGPSTAAPPTVMLTAAWRAGPDIWRLTGPIQHGDQLVAHATPFPDVLTSWYRRITGMHPGELGITNDELAREWRAVRRPSRSREGYAPGDADHRPARSPQPDVHARTPSPDLLTAWCYSISGTHPSELGLSHEELVREWRLRNGEASAPSYTYRLARSPQPEMHARTPSPGFSAAWEYFLGGTHPSELNDEWLTKDLHLHNASRSVPSSTDRHPPPSTVQGHASSVPVHPGQRASFNDAPGPSSSQRDASHQDSASHNLVHYRDPFGEEYLDVEVPEGYRIVRGEYPIRFEKIQREGVARRREGEDEGPSAENLVVYDGGEYLSSGARRPGS